MTAVTDSSLASRQTAFSEIPMIDVSAMSSSGANGKPSDRSVSS